MCPRIQETRPVVTCRGVGRGPRGRRVVGLGRVHSVSLSTSLYGGHSMTVMEEDGSRVNVEGDGTAPTETDDLQAIPSASQPVQMEESLVGSYQHPYQT